jgi:hypothetical protein
VACTNKKSSLNTLPFSPTGFGVIPSSSTAGASLFVHRNLREDCQDGSKMCHKQGCLRSKDKFLTLLHRRYSADCAHCSFLDGDKVMNNILTTKLTGVAAFFLLMMGCSGSDESKSTVKVFQSDAAVQCESEGISVEDMQKILAAGNIKVRCAQKGNNGMMHTTLCGSPTGSINIYTIPKDQLEQAQTLGFIPVSTLPDYQDVACE